MALAAGWGMPARAILSAGSDWQLPADFLIAALSSEEVPRADVRPDVQRGGERDMKKYLITSAVVLGIAATAYAEDFGVHAGPTGAGVTVGETHDRDRPVIKEHEHSDSKTVIKKEDENGNREKTVIHHDHD